ncbi:MAG TPA: signal peptidase I [Solirubrobacteraceae bacterium]|nr:signal peptidase I [Solirubrobacteraceae bacterium]
MATLRIAAEHAWETTPAQTGTAGHGVVSRGTGKRARTAGTVVRACWVWAQRALLTLAVVLFLGLGVLPRLGLYRPVTVLSGSMRPTFSPGDMVIDTPEPVSAVRVGQVISYQVPVGIHQVETHRVVSILQGGAHPTIQTQGDANNYHDPWTAKLEGDTAWRMRAVIPHLGYVVNVLRGPTLRLAAILLAPALLAALVLAEIWGLGGATRREPKPGPALLGDVR